MADPAAQNSKAPVLAPPVPGPDSGGGALGGPTWLAAAEQAWLGRAASRAPRRHRERLSLRPAPGPRATPGSRAPAPRLCADLPARAPKAGGDPPPSPSSAARRGLLPASFPTSGPGGLGSPGSEASPRPAGRAALLPGRAPREASGASAPELRARIPGAGSGGERETGRCSDGGGRGAGGLGAPCGWEDGAQDPSWTREVPKGSGRVLLQRSGLGGEGGGRRVAVCDLVVT